MNALVVVNDPASADPLEHTLRQAGHGVEVAPDGLSALRRLEQGDIRLVISDWELPGMTGEQLCRAVRASDLKRYVYFIMLASGSGTGEVGDGLAAGADDFVRKPLEPAELLMRVRTASRIVSMETLDMTIFAMAKLAELRDTETGRHVERVARYSRCLARYMMKMPGLEGQIDHDFVTLIYQAAPLHDIGKVAIPDAILMKSMPLTPAEYALMKTHTLLGAQTLEAAISEYPDARFLAIARDIAASHHERWDGSGYPNNLRGGEIPLAARIVALADVYDAMTSARPYKPPYQHDYVRRAILADAGRHFDPDVVQAFSQSEPNFVAILRRLGDLRVPTVRAA